MLLCQSLSQRSKRLQITFILESTALIWSAVELETMYTTIVFFPILWKNKVWLKNKETLDILFKEREARWKTPCEECYLCIKGETRLSYHTRQEKNT